MDDITVTFPGNKRVDARVEGFTLRMDQPEKDGGDGAHPTPSHLFFASLAACSGYYALAFCQKRGIDTSKLSLSVRMDEDEKTHMVTAMDMRLTLPGEFPEKYRKAVVRAMGQCYVKKHLDQPPAITLSIAD